MVVSRLETTNLADALHQHEKNGTKFGNKKLKQHG